jgi:predicted enzyme related to lactoylglutathione lyase
MLTPAIGHHVVHLELHTGNLPRACAFFTRLFGWRAETVHVGAASYVALDLGDAIQGGVVEDDLEHPLWIPYVEVADIAEATRRARRLGATVTLGPREGPTGWRCIIGAPAPIALWQPKQR